MNGHNGNVTNEQPEVNGAWGELVDDEWDDAKIAELVDFDDSPEIPSEIVPGNEEQEAVNSPQTKNAVPLAELFDDPIQGKTQPTLSKSGSAKASAVGLVMLLGFGGGGLFLSSVFNQPRKKASVAVRPTPQVTPSVTPTPETETGKLKTQIALLSQERQIKDLEKSKTPRTSVAKKTQHTAPQPVSSPTPPPRTVAPPAYAASPPRTVPAVSRQYTPPPPPPRTASIGAASVRRQPVAVASSPLPTSQSVKKAADPKPQEQAQKPAVDPKPREQVQKPAIDPMQQWMAMSRIGSYGNSNVGEKEPIVVADLPTAPIVRSTEKTQTASVKSVITIPRAIPVVSPTDGAVVASAQSAAPFGASAASPSVPSQEAALPLASSTKEPNSETQTSSGSGESSDTSLLMPQQEPLTEHAQVRDSVVAQTAPVTPAPQASQEGQIASSIPTPAPAQVEAPSVAQVDPAEEASVLNGTPKRRLTVGAQAQGQLVTPVIWAGRGQAKSATQSAASEKFIVQLTQALTDKDGSVTLPPRTQIVAQVVGVNESGLAQLEVTQAIVDGQEYVLPPGAISIRGNNGQPLMASKWGDKGPAIASGDATAFLFGSLAKVGEVMNRPDVESSASVSGYDFSQSTTTRSGRRNLLGAVLEGGFGPLAQQILKRNERGIQEIMSRPDVWYVSAGTSLQVFVNQSFEF